MSFRKLYCDLNLEDSHCAAIRKVAAASQKSNHVLLGMMIRRNKQVQDSINGYFALHKNKLSKCRPPFRLKVSVPQKDSRERTLRISIYNRQTRQSQQIRSSKQLKEAISTPRKKPYQQQQHVRAQSKLSVIQFPTYAAELHLSASKKLSSEQFVRKQLSNIGNNSTSDFDKAPFLPPLILSSQQQQLLMDENVELADSAEKQNKSLSIRVRTFKSFQQYESVRIGTSRPTYLKPIPIQRFFTRFQSEMASRAELIHPRSNLRRGNM